VANPTPTEALRLMRDAVAEAIAQQGVEAQHTQDCQSGRRRECSCWMPEARAALDAADAALAEEGGQARPEVVQRPQVGDCGLYRHGGGPGTGLLHIKTPECIGWIARYASPQNCAQPAPTAAPATAQAAEYVPARCSECGTRMRNGICQPCAEEAIEEGSLQAEREAQQAAARTETPPSVSARLKRDAATARAVFVPVEDEPSGEPDPDHGMPEAPPQGACAECLGVCWHLVSQTPRGEGL
jgi:hypothetical protein